MKDGCNPFSGMVLEEEISNAAWWALIEIAVKHQNRAGKFRSVRMDRSSVYMVRSIHELANTLVFDCVIPHWPAGFRRLQTIENELVADFKKLHRKCHNDI